MIDSLRVYHTINSASPPVSSETNSFISRGPIEPVALCIDVLFCLGWWDVSDGAKQASVIEPIDPAEYGYFQILHVAPRSLAMDQFGFAEAVYRLNEGVVKRVTYASDLWLETRLGLTFGIANVGSNRLSERAAGHAGLAPKHPWPGWRFVKQISREAAKSVLADRQTRHPRMRSAYVSVRKTLSAIGPGAIPKALPPLIDCFALNCRASLLKLMVSNKLWAFQGAKNLMADYGCCDVLLYKITLVIIGQEKANAKASSGEAIRGLERPEWT